MTTVLARPLGGYGLTPLIFEPSIIMMQGSSSNSVATKIRKSPVYELIMPTYDEELPMTGASEQQLSTTTKALKKRDYNTMDKHQPKQSNSKSSSASSSPPSGSHYFQS
ncbi:hypothetical protein BLA29_013070, partial [Euroglyphus maynei]